jgi:fucose permease
LLIGRRGGLFAGACAAMFLFGIVLAVLGALFGLPEMHARVSVTFVQQGDIFLVLFFGVFLSTAVVGPLIDSFGNKHVLVTSSVLVTIALGLFATAHSFSSAIGAAFLLGFGGGGLNTSANALVADVYPDNRGTMLNIVQMFYGVGALLMPLLAAVITGIFSITQLLLAVALLAAICAMAYALLPFPEPRETGGFSLLGSIRAARTPGVLLFGALLFCESGNESSIGGWMSTYADAVGATPRTATWILAAYWAALMFGRLLGARFVDLVPKPRLVLASGIGSAIGSTIIVFAHSIAVLAAGAVITGFSFATIYPTTLAIAADRYERQAATIFGLLFAVGLCGGMVFPWVVGHVSQSTSIRSAMFVPVAGALAVCVLRVIQSRD